MRAGRVAEHRIPDLLDGVGSIVPGLVCEMRIRGYRVHFHADLLERLVFVSQVAQFGRADEGEVSRVEDDDRPFALQVGVGYGTKLAVVKSGGFERFDFGVDQ
jgi:hypothetical protein